MKTNPLATGLLLAPIDSDSARVVSGKGVSFESKKKITQRHWEICPPLRPVPHGFANIIGTTFGRFTVVGLYRFPKKLWVVRCLCGNYETRKERTVRNSCNADDCCQKCREMIYLHRRQEFLSYGKNQ